MQQQNLYLYSGRRVAYSLFLAGLLLLVPWGAHLYAHFIDGSVLQFGMRPWDPSGFLGIVTMPFLHGGTDHLVSNSIPFLVLGAGLFFYYRDVAWRVLGFIVLFTGVTLWFIGTPGSNHIGASGVVYGLVGFHLMGGVIRRNRHLMAFAMLVVFLYGGFIWSIFPDFFPDRNISWEGHLTGLAAGVIMAFRCRGKGPESDPVLPDDDEDDDEDEDEEAEKRSDEPTEGDPEKEKSKSGNGMPSTTAGQRPVRYHVS